MNAKMKMKKSVSAAVLWMISLVILIPLYLVVINSFKSKAEAAEMNLSLPTHWQAIQNYTQMITEGGMLTGFKNSIVITCLCVVMIVVFASMSAFVLQRRKTKASGVLFTLFLTGILLPLQIIPTIFLCNFMHLGSFLSAVLVLTVANFSVAFFLYSGFLSSVPKDLDESAIIDGAGPLRMFFQIIFPLLKPVTVTVIIVSFMSVWNDFGISIYFLNSSENYTISLTIYNFFGIHNSDWQLIFANVVATSIPVVALYLFLQRYIISGMTSGSVKG